MPKGSEPVALRLPIAVRAPLQRERERRGKPWRLLAAGVDVDPAVLSVLEAGGAALASPSAVLQALRHAASLLDLDGEQIESLVLAAWSSAYAGGGSAAPAYGPDTAPLPVSASTAAGGVPDVGPGRRPEPSESLERRAGPGPAVAAPTWRKRHRVLPGMVLAVGLVDAMAAGTLALAQAGVLRASAEASGPVTPAAVSARSAPGASVLAVRSVPAPGGVQVEVPAAFFDLQVATSQPTWVSVQRAGASPVIAAVLQAGESRTVHVDGPVSVVVGASGTTVTLTAGPAVAVVHPSSAPETLTFVPSGAGSGGRS